MVITNIITNGNFESGSAGWFFYTNGGGSFNTVPDDLLPGGSVGQILITATGSNVQLSQTDLLLQPNTEYKLSFRAYSKSGNGFSVQLLQGVSPYTNYGFNQDVVLTKTWQTFTYIFNTTGFSTTVADARFMIWLAPFAVANDVYYIDDIVLGVNIPEPPVPVWTFQWQKNGVDIPGATNQSYTTPIITVADNGAKFSCIATNNSSSFTSQVATILVATATGSNPPTSSCAEVEAKIDTLIVDVNNLTVQTATLTNQINILSAEINALDSKLSQAIIDVSSSIGRIESSMVKKNEFVKIVTQ